MATSLPKTVCKALDVITVSQSARLVLEPQISRLVLVVADSTWAIQIAAEVHSWLRP